jgi:hypothetical protein
LWRVVVTTATTNARRIKGAWSSLGIGISLGDILGDIIYKYGTILRERERE